GMQRAGGMAVLDHGRLEEVAPPLEVYHRPRTRFVGEFIGDSNFFTGTIDPAHPGRVDVDGLEPIPVDPEACRRIGASRVDVLVRPERVHLAGLGVPAVLPMT